MCRTTNQHLYLRPIQQLFSVPGMSLGHRIRLYREKLGWTLETLAEKSEVDIGTINALENRGSKRSQFTAQLARAFGLSIEQLLDESHDWLTHPSAVGPAAGPREVTAHEPPGAYDPWPLPGVTRKQYFQVLTAADRSEVLGFVKGLLKARQAKRRAA